jgi:hypothetical protein
MTDLDEAFKTAISREVLVHLEVLLSRFRAVLLPGLRLLVVLVNFKLPVAAIEYNTVGRAY